MIERAVVLAERETVELVDLPFEIQKSAESTRIIERGGLIRDSSREDSVLVTAWSDDDPESERKQLVEALQACGGNKTKAAKRLGLPRSTYFSKLKKYGIADDESTGPPRYGRLPR